MTSSADFPLPVPRPVAVDATTGRGYYISPDDPAYAPLDAPERAGEIADRAARESIPARVGAALEAIDPKTATVADVVAALRPLFPAPPTSGGG